MRLTILAPAYNEEEVIEGFCAVVMAALPDDAELLVVDDGSIDETPKLLEIAARADQRIRVITHPSNGGVGATLATGFAAARGDVIVTMDADLSHPIELLPTLVAACDDADAAYASRYIEGGGMVGVPWWRQSVSRLANRGFRLLLRSPIHDLTTGYRAFRAEVVRDMPLTSTGFEAQLEISMRLAAENRRIVEVPLMLRQRPAGMSKMQYFRIIPRYTRALLSARRLRKGS